MKDFLMAYKLIYNNIRIGRKQDFRKTAYFYDEELEIAVQKIQNILLPFIVFILGSAIVLGIPAALKVDLKYLEIIFIIWIPVHVFLISPLIYKIICPKNISSHIILKSSLSEEELNVFSKNQEEKHKLLSPEKKHKYGYLP